MAVIVERNAGSVGISSFTIWRVLAMKKELMRIELTDDEISEYARALGRR